MLLFNEKHEQLNADAVAADLANLDDVATPTGDEVEAILQDYYKQALQLEGARYGFKAEFAAPAALAAFPGIGSILDAIRKFICGIVNEGSTTQQIIDAILQAIASVIPGGIIINLLVKPVIKYILSIGIKAFCPVNPV